MQYNYEALDGNGHTIKDVIEADSTVDAIALLRNAGMFPIKVRGGPALPRRKTNSMNTSMIPKFRLKRLLTTMEKVMMVIISIQGILITGLIMEIIKAK